MKHSNIAAVDGFLMHLVKVFCKVGTSQNMRQT